MDLEEALAVLGLEAATSEDVIRRAYLRAVRRHPPERDPEGFQRVRAAYERLRGAPFRSEGRAVVVRQSSPPGTTKEESPLVVQDAPTPPPAPQDTVEQGFDPYRPPSRPARPELSPWQVLENALQLLEKGKRARARQLVHELEGRTTRVGMRVSEIGSRVVARWTLVSELLALDGIATRELMRALAEGIRTGDFDEAETLYEDWCDLRGPRSVRAFGASAPNLLKALVRGAPSARARSDFSVAFNVWRWIALAIVGSQVVRVCVTHERGTDAPSLSRAAPGVESPSSAAPRARAEPEPPGLRLANAAKTIDEAARLRDCNTVREQWPIYAREVRRDTRSGARESYATFRASVVAQCAELDGELTEAP